MSTLLGTTLSPELLERLQGPAQGWRDEAFFLTTTDRRGRPHAALLSYDEAWAPAVDRIRLALYADSGTSDNLRLRGVCALLLVAPGRVHYVKGVAHEIETGLPGHPGWALFEMAIEELWLDAARSDREGAVTLTGGLRLCRGGAAPGLRHALENM